MLSNVELDTTLDSIVAIAAEKLDQLFLKKHYCFKEKGLMLILFCGCLMLVLVGMLTGLILVIVF